MNFLTKKNIVKYVFTQNIDGLEKKAKIPDNKLIFAHGNFLEGHCAKCKREIDINKITKSIEKGEVLYCKKCKGPCKPKVVFYGENLPQIFYDKMNDCKDIDLIIIMGTSLKVQPFASIPYHVKDAYIAVFNMEEVGEYYYGRLTKDSIFIEGKTDESIIKFLKDTNLFDEFKTFIKSEYNEELDNIIDIKNKMLNVDELTKGIKNMNLNEK